MPKRIRRKPGEPKRKPGPKRIVFDLQVVEALARAGMSQGDMALVLLCSEDTITREKQRNPEFAEAMEKGRGNRRLWLRRSQDRMVEGGNATMAIFLGKNELQQTDRQLVQQVQVSVTPEELAAMSDEEVEALAVKLGLR